MAQSAPTVLLRRDDDYDSFANDEAAVLDIQGRSTLIEHGIPMESINVGAPPASRGEDGQGNEPGLRSRWQMPKTKKKNRDIDAEGEELVWPLPPNIRGTDADLNMLVHLYRGDVTRLTSYRQRLDATTNWAVTLTSVLVAFSLGSNTTGHYFFGFILILQLFFCGVEARRLVYYRLVRHRCRLFERGLFSHLLMPDMPASDWKKALRDTYMADAKLIPFRQGFMIRIKRIYGFLVLATYMGWIFKLISLTDFGQPFPWVTFGVVSAVIFPICIYAIFFFGDRLLDV